MRSNGDHRDNRKKRNAKYLDGIDQNRQLHHGSKGTTLTKMRKYKKGKDLENYKGEKYTSKKYIYISTKELRWEAACINIEQYLFG